MSYWEGVGASDEWYTPAYIFEAMGVQFDLDPANGDPAAANVPARRNYGTDGLTQPWDGFVWLNAPFGGRNGLAPWLDRFFAHANGVALTPDRTSAPWWQAAARKSDAILFVAGKIKFERPDGTVGKSPSNGTTLMACGNKGIEALITEYAAGLGVVVLV